MEVDWFTHVADVVADVKGGIVSGEEVALDLETRCTDDGVTLVIAVDEVDIV